MNKRLKVYIKNMSISIKLLSKQRMSTFFAAVGMSSLCVSISGKPGTCEKTGRFQCNNGKCIGKSDVCNSCDDCGDDSDESMKDGAFCGRWTSPFKDHLLKILL